MNPQRNELSIQEFIDLDFDEIFFPVTTRLQKMLPETLSSGSINEQLAEFLATMIYNLEASLVNTKDALLRTRLACTVMMSEIVEIQSKLLELGFSDMAERQKDFYDKMQQELMGPHWDAIFPTDPSG
jgi:hypothetical protein